MLPLRLPSTGSLSQGRFSGREGVTATMGPPITEYTPSPKAK